MLVFFARFKAEKCRNRYFKIVSSGGPSLPLEEIMSSHNVEHPVHVNCNFLCVNDNVSKCVGFNFREKTKGKAINCQLTNNTKKRKYKEEGEWTLYRDVDAAENENEKKKTSEATPVTSCSSLYKSGERKDGVYTINPDGLGSFQVRCDMQTDGGGWTVFQRRQDASVDFYRGWQDYKNGFGDLNGNFWLGLDRIHRLTKSGQNVLRVDLMDWTNDKAYAKYGSFSVASESDGYRLDLGSFSGNAGDSLTYHNGMKFSTYNRDNDQRAGSNCAVIYQGAWWYKTCHHSNLNGLYLKAGKKSYQGIRWHHWKKDDRSMKKNNKIPRHGRQSWGDGGCLHNNLFLPRGISVLNSVCKHFGILTRVEQSDVLIEIFLLLHIIKSSSVSDVKYQIWTYRNLKQFVFKNKTDSEPNFENYTNLNTDILRLKLESSGDCCGILRQKMKMRKRKRLKVSGQELGSARATPVTSCSSLYKSGERKDGVYTINPDGLGSFQVRCDMQTDGGGWTVFQRRQNVSVDFYRGWQDYKNGFGDPNGNFWLGLDRIHRLTNSGQNVLRVDLMDWTNDTAYAKYGSFSVASESDGYRLDLDNYTMSITYSLKSQNVQIFEGNFISKITSCLCVSQDRYGEKILNSLLTMAHSLFRKLCMMDRFGAENEQRKTPADPLLLKVVAIQENTLPYRWHELTTGETLQNSDAGHVFPARKRPLSTVAALSIIISVYAITDNDGGKCAVHFHGAWWYNGCHHSNLNGRYLKVSEIWTYLPCLEHRINIKICLLEIWTFSLEIEQFSLGPRKDPVILGKEHSSLLSLSGVGSIMGTFHLRDRIKILQILYDRSLMSRNNWERGLVINILRKSVHYRVRTIMLTIT
ncbi:Hypothetical predicted protein, partial [Paramuricea clavata]